LRRTSRRCLRLAGITPDAFLAEFGPQQFEVTTTPKIGVRAADEAVITRDRCGRSRTATSTRVSLAPMADPAGVANGTHIHFSLLDRDGQPCLYDPEGTHGIAPAAEAFVAGILAALPAVCALSAASVASYYRLRPNRWAPVRSDLGAYDRGAALRVSPMHAADDAERARQYNLEFRVADATGNPYLVLTALVRAGLDGLRSGASLVRHVPRSLPTTLTEALSHLESAPDSWLGAGLKAGYVQFKRAEARRIG
jgi:glutamine synthetase